MKARPHEIRPACPCADPCPNCDAGPLWMWGCGVIGVGLVCAVILLAVGYVLGSWLQKEAAGRSQRPAARNHSSSTMPRTSAPDLERVDETPADD